MKISKNIKQGALDVVYGKRNWCVIEGDNSKIVPALPLVDHVVSDPPYNASTHANARSLKDGGSDIGIDFEPIEPSGILTLLGAARRWIIAFCALEDLGMYAQMAGRLWVRAGIWDRPDGTPQLSADRPGQAAEGIAIMHSSDTKKEWNSGGKRGMWRHGVERVERHHPTPKPLPLMLELIGDFTRPGDVVLDPFCGSGTTGVACLRLGRRFIGVELNPAYAAISRKRLEAEERGLSLSEAESGQTTIFDALNAVAVSKRKGKRR